MRILITLSACCALALLAYANTQPNPEMVSNNTAEAIGSVYVFGDFEAADPNGTFSVNDTLDQNQTLSDLNNIVSDVFTTFEMLTVEIFDDFSKMFAGNATQTE